MALSLIKGQNAALDPGLTRVFVGLGWQPRVGAGAAFDLDASCIMLTSERKVRGDHDFIFYNQLQSPCGSVKHLGDNLDGVSDEDAADDETIEVDLSSVPAEIERLVFSVTIYQATERDQNFGMVDDAYMRIVDATNGNEIARFDLTEDACVNQSILFGELYRRNGAWKFRALGQGVDGDLGAIARSYGVKV